MHTLSLAEVFTLRNQAFAEIREHTTAIDRTAAAIANMDAAMAGRVA